MSYVAVSPGDAPPAGLAGLGALQLPVTASAKAPADFRRRTPVAAPTPTPAPGRVEIPPPAAPPTPEDLAFAKRFVDKLTEFASKQLVDTPDPVELQRILALTKDQLKSLVEQAEKAGKPRSAMIRAAFEQTVAETAALAPKSKTPMIVAGVAVAAAVAAFVFLRRK
jgi:hypothetical protein